MSDWRILGTSDDVLDCGVCGKQELKSTVHLLHVDGDDVYAGSDCAARMVGGKGAEVRKLAGAADREAREAARVEYGRRMGELIRDEEAAVAEWVRTRPELAGASYYRQLKAWQAR